MYKVSVHFVAYRRSDGWGRKSSIGGHCSIKSGESMARPLHQTQFSDKY